jgi:PIN domain nuclease of toxin-antitoxin system
VRLLLDTHVLVWWLNADKKLGERARRIVEADAAGVWLSAAVFWEMSIKAAAGQLKFPVPFTQAVDRAREFTRFRPMSIDAAHAVAAGALPLRHRDPFDRMLIAQAQLEDLTIVTSDAQFEDYDVTLLDARL